MHVILIGKLGKSRLLLVRVFNFVIYTHISSKIIHTWPATSYLLEQLLQLGGDSITDLDGGSLAANIASAHTSFNDVAHGLLDDASLVEQTEGVLHHHGNGKDGGNGVDDTLAGDVRSGT